MKELIEHIEKSIKQNSFHYPDNVCELTVDQATEILQLQQDYDKLKEAYVKLVDKAFPWEIDGSHLRKRTQALRAGLTINEKGE